MLREGLEVVTGLIGPMMPHLAEEMWRTLGHATLIADAAWPKPDPELVRDEQVTLAVQVNGKLRGTVELPRDAAASEAEEAALALPQVAKLLDGKPPRKDRRRAEPDRQRGCVRGVGRAGRRIERAGKTPLRRRGSGWRVPSGTGRVRAAASPSPPPSPPMGERG